MSPLSLSRKLDGGEAVVLPNISPLTDRRSLHAASYEGIATNLEKNGFTVGWDDGSLQVGGTPTHSGLGTPTHRTKRSGFLSFGNRAREAPARPRTSASFSGGSALLPPAPLTPQPPSRDRRDRFTRLSASLDTSNLRILHSAGSARQLQAQPAGPAPGPTAQFDPNGSDANHHPQPADPYPPPTRGSGASAANPALPSSSKVAAHMRLSVPLENLRDSERRGYGPSHTTRSTGVVQVPLGVPSTASPQATAATFRATRGHALVVFNELDTDKNGKVTQSELEAAALSLGFSLEQAHRLWERLDKKKRGFLEAGDWGTRDMFTQIQLFSTRYLQKYMGYPSISDTPEQVRKYWRSQEMLQVKSLAAAINLVRANAMSRGMQVAGGDVGNPVYAAFRFMDSDGSGELSKDELSEAFFSMGVYLSEQVVDQIMKLFDKDGSGSVQYHEFERTMFPVARGG